MVTEDYISFETAKLLKEKGFEGDTSCYYIQGNAKRWVYQHYHDFDKKDRIECPTLQMAMKWLREIHHLTIDVFHFRDWKVNIKTIPDDYFKADYSYPELKPAETFEEACEAAIKYCLENLI